MSSSPLGSPGRSQWRAVRREARGPPELGHRVEVDAVGAQPLSRGLGSAVYLRRTAGAAGRAAASGRLLGDHLHAAAPEGVRDHGAAAREQVAQEAPVVAQGVGVGRAQVG